MIDDKAKLEAEVDDMKRQVGADDAEKAHLMQGKMNFLFIYLFFQKRLNLFFFKKKMEINEIVLQTMKARLDVLAKSERELKEKRFDFFLCFFWIPLFF